MAWKEDHFAPLGAYQAIPIVGLGGIGRAASRFFKRSLAIRPLIPVLLT